MIPAGIRTLSPLSADSRPNRLTRPSTAMIGSTTPPRCRLAEVHLEVNIVCCRLRSQQVEAGSDDDRDDAATAAAAAIAPGPTSRTDSRRGNPGLRAQRIRRDQPG